MTGDDLAALLAGALDTPGPGGAVPVPGGLVDGDVLVVTQKVVSKAEGRIVEVDAADPEVKRVLVESESVRVLRRRDDLLITETRHGFICANAGVDLSNMAAGTAALLPLDPDLFGTPNSRGIRAPLPGVSRGDHLGHVRSHLAARRH